MRGNTFGKLLSITSFGESHGEAMGVIIDGVPAGLDFSLEDLHRYKQVSKIQFLECSGNSGAMISP